ncbi:MAG: hypothetical protein CMN21_12895 [Rubinisphaera sp.]|nr:hypothetical protein [Rubinisphaera sp.]
MTVRVISDCRLGIRSNAGSLLSEFFINPCIFLSHCSKGEFCPGSFEATASIDFNSLTNPQNTGCLENSCMSVGKFTTSDGDAEIGNDVRAPR